MCKRRKKPIIVCVPISRRRRRVSGGGVARIDQRQRVGSVSGLINPVVQIPINLGDANAISNSRGNSITNLL